MKTITTPIIPTHVEEAWLSNAQKQVLDYEAICLFVASGFFWDQDTYWRDKKTLPPASHVTLSASNELISATPYFSWHSTPKTYTFQEALEAFTSCFESVIDDQVAQQSVILPISGGLDSRTQAVALKHLKKEVQGYSYSFENGYSESQIAKQIAKACDFNFQEFTIPKGYLWDVVEDLATINKCYSEFTHPRQMAVLPELKHMSGVFSLGHWGDVLFDKGLSEQDKAYDMVTLVKKKVLKKGGLELAKALWISWDLEGDFETYLNDRITTLLNGITIKNQSAKMRAFKSKYWATRWTTSNLSIFEAAHPITLPYYDNRMCELICELPETFLADRALQIAYLKKRMPNVARITWEEQRPFHLYNYQYNKLPYNLPFKIQRKLKRGMQKLVQKHDVQRNWELQFLGDSNTQYLERYLFHEKFDSLVPKDITTNMYQAFQNKDSVNYAHPVSMLLTLSIWNKQQGI